MPIVKAEGERIRNDARHITFVYSMRFSAVVVMFAHTSRYIIRRDTLARWLVDDVSKTAQAPALAMLRAFTQKIMPLDSKEEPGDVFQRGRSTIKTERNRNRKRQA